MIGASLRGRLGNSLFQAAAIHAHAKRTGNDYVVDFGSPNPDKSHVRDLKRMYIPIANPECIHWKNHIEQKGFEYHSLEAPDGDTLYHGYFQSEKFFSDCTDEIFQRYTRIDKHARIHRSVCAVHVRRGDYLAPNISSYFPLQNESYYRKAIAHTPANRFYFCSDDIEWCREVFGDIPGAMFSRIDIEQPLVELHHASTCEYVIGSNSSFSWWIAWLSDYRQGKKGNVILPENWFGPSASDLDKRDLIPEHWKTM
jgi:hypothetical protein